jgi:uncharacterized OsmC-like protein
LPWTSLHCAVNGTLDRPDGQKTQFTAFALHATLVVPPGVDADKATRLLEKAEASCLVTNSLSASTHLTCAVSTGR